MRGVQEIQKMGTLVPSDAPENGDMYPDQRSRISPVSGPGGG